MKLDRVRLRTRASFLVRLALAAVICGAILPVSGAQASAAPESFVTMISEPGDWIGGGANRFYHPGNASITVAGGTGSVSIDVTGGNLGDSFDLTFASAPGEPLVAGQYEDAQRAPFREAGRPGIDIGGSGRGCNTIEGRFRVNQISRGPSGSISGLWIVYEQHCEGDVPALIGEVRYNVEGPGGEAVIGPQEIRWPKADVGAAMKVVPITVWNPTSHVVSFGPSSISGPDQAEFSVRVDNCSGIALDPGATCQILIRFVPGSPGHKNATLSIPEGGFTHSALLKGYVYPGTTRIQLHSDPGDWVGAGGDYDYLPSNSTISVSGGYERVWGSVEATNGDSWNFNFDAPNGDVLAPGDTYQATRYPFNGTGPGMSWSGNGRGCNELSGTFTVNELSVDSVDELKSLDLDFEQHCEGEVPALHGSIKWRAGAPSPEEFQLTVTKSGIGDGIVTSTPSGIECGDDCTDGFAAGVQVTLTSTPLERSRFAGWSGACSGSFGNSCKLTLSEPTTVGAEFVRKSSTTISVAKRRGRLWISGRVLPKLPEGRVRLTLFERHDGRFILLDGRWTELDDRSRYLAGFRRPGGTVCRVKAVFPGFQGFDRSEAKTRFLC